MIDLFTDFYFFTEKGISIDLILRDGILHRRVYSIGAAWGGNHKVEVPFSVIKKEELTKVAKHLMEVNAKEYFPIIKKLMEDGVNTCLSHN